jgi:hypothetical protein
MQRRGVSYNLAVSAPGMHPGIPAEGIGEAGHFRLKRQAESAFVDGFGDASDTGQACASENRQAIWLQSNADEWQWHRVALAWRADARCRATPDGETNTSHSPLGDTASPPPISQLDATQDTVRTRTSFPAWE